MGGMGGELGMLKLCVQCVQQRNPITAPADPSTQSATRRSRAVSRAAKSSGISAVVGDQRDFSCPDTNWRTGQLRNYIARRKKKAAVQAALKQAS